MLLLEKKIQIIHENQAGSVPYRKSVSLNLAVCANFLEGCTQRGFFFSKFLVNLDLVPVPI